MRPFHYPRAPVSLDDMQIICHGNSLTNGAGSSGASAKWPAVTATLSPLSGTGISLVNAGVNGQRIASPGMRTTGPTAVDAILSTTKLNVLFAWEFTNELSNNGWFPVSAHNQLVAYCNERKAAAVSAGAQLHIIVVTVLPFRTIAASQTDTDNHMAGVVTVNETMRKNYRTYADQLMDLAAHEPWASMYAANDWSNAAFAAQSFYNRSDGVANDNVHPGDAAYARIAQIAAHAITRVRLK
jgi:lysophospholipase L1-like esterase